MDFLTLKKIFYLVLVGTLVHNQLFFVVSHTVVEYKTSLGSGKNWRKKTIETGSAKHTKVVREKDFHYVYKIDEKTDFGSFDIQGLGIVSEIDGNKVYIDGDINSINSSYGVGSHLLNCLCSGIVIIYSSIFIILVPKEGLEPSL